MQLRHTTIGELVRLYEEAASQHRKGIEEGTPKVANRAANGVAAAYRELRRRGGNTRDALLPLLLSDDPGVQGWAAAHALEFAPERGRAVLEFLAQKEGSIGFSALMTLKVWHEGTLRFP
jgi:hypothetical protein